MLGGGRVAPTRRAAPGDAPRGPARPRGRSADAVLRARLPARRVRGDGRARRRRRRRRRASGAPLVPHVRNEGHGLLEAVAEMIDVARRSGCAAPPLPPQVARRRAPRRAAARSCSRAQRAGDRPDVRPVPLRRGQHAAREHPAGLGAGGRRARDATARSAAARHGGGSRATSPTACPAGRTSSARSARSGSRSRTPRRRTRTPSGRSLAEIAADRGCDPVAAALDLMRRVRPRRDDGAPLRLRRRRANDRRAPPPARRLGRDLRRPPAPAALRHGAALPGAVRDPRGPAPGGGGRGAAHGTRGRPARPGRPRADRGGKARRPRPPRPRDLRRHGDVRRPLPVARRASPASGWTACRAWRDGAPTGARPGGVVR